MTHEHGDEPFPRHALVDLVSIEQAGRARRELAQSWLIGAALVLLALALPNPQLARTQPEVWGPASAPMPFPLIASLVRALAGSTGQTYEGAMYLVSALGWGLSLPIITGTLRRIGFDQATALIASILALVAPLTWLGSTTPTSFGAGVLGASLLMAGLFAREHRRLIVPLAFWGAASLNTELLWLLPAVLWALRRERLAQALVGLAAAAYLASLYGSTPLRRAWFAADPIGVDAPRLRNLLAFLMFRVPALCAGLWGLYALMGPHRTEEESPPPTWIWPWCLAFLVALVPGHPGGWLAGSFLVPVAALGLADAIQRHWREDQLLRGGLRLLAFQIALTVFAHGHVILRQSPDWFRTARQHLEPTDFVSTTSAERAWVLRARWGLDAYGPRSRPADLLERAERAIASGRRVVVDGIVGGTNPTRDPQLGAVMGSLLTEEGVVPRTAPR